MLIPSIATWTRSEFCAARAKQMEAQKEMDKRCGTEGVIYVDTDYDEIVCDTCNKEVVTEYINLVEFGRRVNCDECFQKWYARQPVQFKWLKADGSLGPTSNGL